jgi:hypothetical protein
VVSRDLFVRRAFWSLFGLLEEPQSKCARVGGWLLSCARVLLGDISALVLDVGTYNTRAGFGGDALPKCVVPSVRAARAAASLRAACTPQPLRRGCLAVAGGGLRLGDRRGPCGGG